MHIEGVEVGNLTHRVFQPPLQDTTVALQVGVLSCQLIGPIPTFLAAVDQQEGEEKASSNVPEERFTHNPPGPSIAGIESRVLDQWRNEDKGTFAERPTEIFPEHESEVDRISQIVHKDEGEGQSTVKTLPYVNLYRLQGENVIIRHLG